MRWVQQIPRIGEQYKVLHRLSIARYAIPIHHVPEGSDCTPIQCMGVITQSVGVIPQKTRPIEYQIVTDRTVDGGQVFQVGLTRRGDYKYGSDSRHDDKYCDQNQGPDFRCP
jgi:hypothetical protein